MMNSQKVVTPAKAGVQVLCNCSKIMDSGFRRNDRKPYFVTFYETVNNQCLRPFMGLYGRINCHQKDRTTSGLPEPPTYRSGGRKWTSMS
jgi:hypothetical protein